MKSQDVPRGAALDEGKAGDGAPAREGAFGALSRRELEVTMLAIDGLPTREVARRLFRSPKTIENHLLSIYRKLGVANRVELVNLAHRLGVMPGAAQPLRPATPEGESAQAFEALHRLDEHLARAEPAAFFGELVHGLTEILSVRYAGISEMYPGSPTLTVIAASDAGALLTPFEMPLSGCPCEVVYLSGEYLTVERGLRERFPRVELFAEMKAESYVGVRLTDRLLGAVGTLWIVDTRPLDNGGVACKVLKLLAGRTAAELASQKAVDWLHECIESGGSMTEIARKIGAPTK